MSRPTLLVTTALLVRPSVPWRPSSSSSVLGSGGSPQLRTLTCCRRLAEDTARHAHGPERPELLIWTPYCADDLHDRAARNGGSGRATSVPLVTFRSETDAMRPVG